MFNIGILACGVLVMPAYAETEPACSSGAAGCVEVGEWDISIGFGIGLRSNPLIDGDDLPLFVLPAVRYYGEHFFIDTYTGGYTFYDSGMHQLSAVATIGFDQLYFNTRNVGSLVVDAGPILGSSNNTLEEDEYQLDIGGITAGGRESSDNLVPESNESNAPLESPDWRAPIDIDQLHNRNTAVFSGLEWAYYAENWDGSLQLLHDVTAVHKGQEIRAALSRTGRIVNEFIELSLGFSWQSAELLQYYYGVEKDEVEDEALEYYASDGISPFVRLDWRRKIKGNWSWQATLHNRWLSPSIKNSPLLDEDSVLTLYVGGVYHF